MLTQVLGRGQMSSQGPHWKLQQSMDVMELPLLPASLLQGLALKLHCNMYNMFNWFVLASCRI